MSALPFDTYPISIDDQETYIRSDELIHSVFTEQSDPERAVLSWQTHAEGYAGANFLKEDAVDNGFLKPGIDTARGPNVLYYLGEHLTQEGRRASLRKKFPQEGEDYTSLPAHALSAGSLSIEGADYLERLKAEGAEIIEVGAMAKTDIAKPQDMYEVIRNGIHDSLGRNQVWYCTLVSDTYPSLEKNFGKGNLQVLGDKVGIADDRVRDGLSLLPVALEVDTFMSRMHEAYKHAETPAEVHRLKKSIIFYGSGLSPNQLGNELYELRRDILTEQLAKQALKDVG